MIDVNLTSVPSVWEVREFPSYSFLTSVRISRSRGHVTITGSFWSLSTKDHPLHRKPTLGKSILALATLARKLHYV